MMFDLVTKKNKQQLQNQLCAASLSLSLAKFEVGSDYLLDSFLPFTLFLKEPTSDTILLSLVIYCLLLCVFGFIPRLSRCIFKASNRCLNKVVPNKKSYIADVTQVF